MPRLDQRLDEARHNVTGWLGMRRQTPWERLRQIPFNMRQIPSNMRQIPSNMRQIPFNMRQIPFDMGQAPSRMQQLDWRDWGPQRPILPPTRDFGGASFLVGLIVGVGIGLGAGYVVGGSIRPSITRARRQMRKAFKRAEATMGARPARLNITRLEEQEVP